MRLRLNSLKTRTAVAIASVIVAILVVNAVYLILTKGADEPPPRRIQDPQRLAAVKAVADSSIRGRDASGQETLEIVAPYREDWGRHTLSVAYRVNYRNLEPRLARLVYVTGGLTLAS